MPQTLGFWSEFGRVFWPQTCGFWSEFGRDLLLQTLGFWSEFGREFGLKRSGSAAIKTDLREAQSELHSWGRANQVNCDDGKEGFAILSKRKGHAEGADFRILGITFDNSLTMAAAIDELVKDCKWKIRSLLRCQRHFDIAGTVSLFKGQVLPCIEHRTSAIYHAADSLIE